MWHDVATHAFFGISTLWLLTPLPPEIIGYDYGTLAVFAASGVLMPDLDASESKLKHLKLPGTSYKSFLLPSQIIHKSDRHRFSIPNLNDSTFCVASGELQPGHS